MRILFFGDINGRIGIDSLSSLLSILIKRYEADFVIANGENASSNGHGITEREYHELLEAGVDVVTLGNHWHGKRQIEDYIEYCDNLIRPLNLLHFDKGFGSAVYEVGDTAIRVTNILGTAFMREAVQSPYQAMNALLSDEEKIAIHIVDYHGESTSEKKTFAAFYDGRVSAVIGTHTHVQTNDAYIFPKGCGFLSDVGLCGAYDSIIGSSYDSVIKRTVLGEEGFFEIPKDGREIVCFVLIEVDEESGRCVRIKPITYIDGGLFDGEASV
ncbi:MAG: TIGR00282 family metallophosphoesterase [Bacillota bacterium]|nr:TIGR00282 family metallophosphoesterase [Bacillota bacterium]